jgi:hypothetical protein
MYRIDEEEKDRGSKQAKQNVFTATEHFLVGEARNAASVISYSD